MTEEITWKSVPKEIEELNKKKEFGPQSNQLNMIVSEPFEMHAQHAMKDVIKEISQFEVRCDDTSLFLKMGSLPTKIVQGSGLDFQFLDGKGVLE